jgi:hypothetical protein
LEGKVYTRLSRPQTLVAFAHRLALLWINEVRVVILLEAKYEIIY